MRDERSYDEDDDREAPDDSDTEGSGEFDDASVDTIECPYCGKAVYEQAELCHHCGSYLSIEDSAPRRSVWIIVVVIVCLIMVLVGWVFTKPLW